VPADDKSEKSRSIEGDGIAWHKRNLKPIECTQIFFATYGEAREEWRKFLRGEPCRIGWWR